MGFTETATRKLVPKGILALVCPINALVGNRDFVEFLDSHYHNLAVYKFPDGNDPDTGKPVRGYREIVVIGEKRMAPVPKDTLRDHGTLHKMQMQWSGYITIESLPALGQTQPKYSQRRSAELRPGGVPADLGDPALVEAAHLQEDGVHRAGA